MKIPILITLISFCFLFSNIATADEEKPTLSEDQKISLLLTEVEKSGATFIRNGDRHNSKMARKHLEYKYKSATNSFWFFSKDVKVTAQDFVNKIASHSSTTGKKYYIEVKGKKYTTKEWLNIKLTEIVKCSSSKKCTRAISSSD